MKGPAIFDDRMAMFLALPAWLAYVLLTSEVKIGFGRAVSRILSAPLRGRESFVLAADTRNPSRFRETWSGPLRDSLFGLAPDGVFRAASLALHAVRSYRTFSPLPHQADAAV